MGNSSTSTGGGKIKIPIEQYEAMKKFRWSMPPYAVEKYEVTQERIELAASSWRYAMSGEAEVYQQAKAKDPSVTPLVFFYNQFYYFVFELMPETKPMFTRGMKAQGRMLANVIKYIITNLRESDELKVKHSLEHLARVHNVIGVTADAYSLMGLILVQTMRICTGRKYWTNEHTTAWIHIYSKMMAVMIPIVISNERPKLGAIDLEAVEYYRKVNLNPEADASHMTLPSNGAKSYAKNYVTRESHTLSENDHSAAVPLASHHYLRPSPRPESGSLVRPPFGALLQRPPPKLVVGLWRRLEIDEVEEGVTVSGHRYGEHEPEGEASQASSEASLNSRGAAPGTEEKKKLPSMCLKGADGSSGVCPAYGVKGPNHPTMTEDILSQACPMSKQGCETDIEPNRALVAVLTQNVRDHLATLEMESIPLMPDDEEEDDYGEMSPLDLGTPVALSLAPSPRHKTASIRVWPIRTPPSYLDEKLRSIGIVDGMNSPPPPLGSITGRALLLLLQQQDQRMLKKQFLFKL